MNYGAYLPYDVNNGIGMRCTLFVSGCIHRCKGCYNKQTWNCNFGNPYTKEVEDMIIRDLQDEKIVRHGLSISGGDPLLLTNVLDIFNLCRRVKSETTKNIWLWTGYCYENLNSDQMTILKYVDYIVDGKFDETRKVPSLPFRGSNNQRLIRCSDWKVITDLSEEFKF